MKKYLFTVAVVVLMVVVVDIAVGFALDNLSHSIPVTQEKGKVQFARNKVHTDLVVIGSSRAAHHYDVRVLSDSLGCSAYNLGMDGRFFLDNCCVMHALTRRYTPKYLILEISAGAMYVEDKNIMDLQYNYYWSDEYVRDIVNREEGWQTEVKMLSSLFRYNANAFNTISFGLKGICLGKQDDPLKGYVPIAFKKKRKELELHESKSNAVRTVSEWKEGLLSDLLKDATEKGIQVYVITSPSFCTPNDVNTKSTQAIDSICNIHDIPYWNYSSDPLFLVHPEWFSDGTHLNEVGATKFTNKIVRRLMEIRD